MAARFKASVGAFPTLLAPNQAPSSRREGVGTRPQTPPALLSVRLVGPLQLAALSMHVDQVR